MESEKPGWRSVDRNCLTSSVAQSMNATRVDWVLAMAHISEDDRASGVSDKTGVA